MPSVTTSPPEEESARSAYREYLAEREAILQHKWLLSQKTGHDVGFEAALTDWAHHHHVAWRKARGK